MSPIQRMYGKINELNQDLIIRLRLSVSSIGGLFRNVRQSCIMDGTSCDLGTDLQTSATRQQTIHCGQSYNLSYCRTFQKVPTIEQSFMDKMIQCFDNPRNELLFQSHQSLLEALGIALIHKKYFQVRVP